MSNINTPSGYKSSPLGIIPKDWEVKRVKDVSTIKGRIGYRGYTVEDIVNDGNGAISLSPSNIVDGKLQFNSVTSITWEKYYESPEIMLCNGDIVMVKTGSSFGKVAFVDNLPQEATINPQFVIINNIKCDNKWLCYLFDSDCIQKNVHKIVVGGAIPTMSQEEIANFKIAVPTLPEQQRIVSVLSLWDTAIAKQTALIEKLTLRKRGLMQQLLTGKKRLKGFEGEWKKCAIKSFAKEVSIRNTDNKDYVVLSCTKYDGLVPSLEYFGKQIYSNDLSTYKVVPKNHFAYATNHIEEGSIGYQANFNNGLISPMYTVFETDKEKVDDTYLFAVLKSHHLIYLYQAMMEGSINRRGGLRWDSFSTIKVNLPSLEEQKAISGFLQRSDKEIEIQKQKLATLQEQKKGLMQVLLTGKRRVK